MKLALIAWTLIAVVASCTSDGDWLGMPNQTGRDTLSSLPRSGDIELVSANDCAQLADRVRPAIVAQADELERMERLGDTYMAEDASGTIRRENADTSSKAAGAPSARSSGDTSVTTEAADGGSDKTSDRVVGTNVQEVGVDEADFVKADAKRIVTITNGVLRTIALDGTPQIDGTLALPDTQNIAEMYLIGDEALVLDSLYTSALDTTASRSGDGDTGVIGAGSDDSGTSVSGITAQESDAKLAAGGAATRLTRVDLTDLTAPRIVESVVVEGSLTASRAIDSTVRVVLRGDALPVDQLSGAAGPTDLREIAKDLDGEALLPRFSDDEGKVAPLGGCGDVMVQTKSTIGDSLPVNVTVLSVRGSLADLHPVTVQGSADTVYASTDALVVAGSGWSQAGSFTTLHRFDLSSGDKARPTGSGVVAGTLLNQFALSERSGALRVVTTVDRPVENSPGMDIAQAPTSASLAILDAGSSELAELSRVDGLGPGETVQSVRFLDTIAYIVTFRQTDPLYAIDLSDPKAPRNLGELKITGFSQYMHPVGDGLLIGVGREVDPTTGIDSGLKISLFDVSDPTAMKEVDRMVLTDAYSPVSDDHRAFTWDSVNNHAIVPVESSCPVMTPIEPEPRQPMPAEPMPAEPMPAEPMPVEPVTPGTTPDNVTTRGPIAVDPSSGTSSMTEPAPSIDPKPTNCTPIAAALVVGVSANKLTRVAELSHQSDGSWSGVPNRSLIVGNDLWTVSSIGVGRTDAARPGQVDVVRY